LGGADAGNYTLAGSTATLSGAASITPATISAVTGLTASNKVYDATTAAALNAASAGFTGKLGSDTLTVATASGNFVDKNAGNGKTVNVSGLTLGGADAGNYTLASSTATLSGAANITPATISAVTGLTASSKVYDATTAAALNAASAGFTGKLGSDTLTVATATGNFADKNAGIGKTVNVSGLTLGGADAGNYTLASSTATLSGAANITPASITAVTGITASNKVYDATTAAALNAASAGFTGKLGSDTLTVATATGNFVDKNAGNGKTVDVSGLTLGGADAGNYTLASSTATISSAANITPAPVTASVTAANKTYDGTTAAVTQGTVSGVFVGDSVDLLTTGAFSDKNAGPGRTVNVTASLSGADASNYTLSLSGGGTTTADIARRALTVAPTVAPKTYDATTDASASLSDNRVAGDMLNVTYGSASFSDKNAGSGKAVTILGIAVSGLDAGNYSFSPSVMTVGTVTPAVLTVGAIGQSRPYDGGTQASASLTDNRFAGDQLTLGFGSASFANALIANAVPISVGGIRITGGADQGNYVLANTATSTTADIQLPVQAPAPVVEAPLTPRRFEPLIPPVPVTPPAPALELVVAGVTPAASQKAAAAPSTLGTVTPAAAAGTGSAGEGGAIRSNPGNATDTISVTLVRESAGAQSGLVAVAVPRTITAAGSGFSFPLPSDVARALGDQPVQVSLMEGAALPAWLHYASDAKSFTANAAPAGALPLDLLIRSGKRQWTVTITETNAR
jgi:hypothetical protein